jgi:hypothetical protein
MTPEGDQMTLKSDQMTPEGDHCRMISRHRMMPLSPARYTKYYVHIGLLLSVRMELLTSPVSRHNRYS